MKQIYYAWKTLLHHRGASAIKVVSVGIGLGMAALLLASVAYTRSFDRHFPDDNSESALCGENSRRSA